MAVCIIIWKAIKVWRALANIKEVKRNAYRKSIRLPPKYGCCKTLLYCCGRGVRAVLLRLLCPCCFWKDRDGRSTWEILRTDGTLANSVVKSLLGLIVGLLITQVITVFLILQLNFDPVTTTYASMGFGTLLTLALAFSETTRLFLFLTLPQFFTKKGRAAILAYCLILALSGPAKNTTRNMEILTESLLCSQEMAHNATRGLINLVKDPYSAMGGALKGMVDAVKDASAAIMGGLRHLMNMIVAVVNAIKGAIKWVREIMSFCNTKVGSPSTKCRAAFDEATDDCKDRLGSAFGWMCSPVSLFKHLCHIAQWGEGVVCWLPGLIRENVLDPIKNGLKDIGAGIKKFFDVRIRFDYELEGSFTSSKSFREVVRGMKGEILEEIHWLTDYLDWCNLLASLFIVLALYKALIYRHRFLTIDRHDNFFITKGIVQLDLRMRRLGRNPVFPLKYREAYTYVQPFSLVLIESEKKALKQQLAFVSIAALKILSYVFLDYVFYLFLLLVQKYGAFHVDTRKLLGHGVTVSGTGFMAAMYRGILTALSPIGSLLPVFDTSPCLPIPSKPNYYRYAMIFFLIILCYLACLTEPYGMRFRHVICGIYYPARKLPRDRWLYTHIIAGRENFIFFARNELRSMLSKGKTTYRVGIAERLSHTSPCFRFLFGLLRMRRKKCFLCGLSGDLDDTENFVHCPSCNSVYCSSCYEEVGGRCVACVSPMEFGDISEETVSHSSDDDDAFTKKEIAQIIKRKKRAKREKKKSDEFNTSSDSRSPLLQSESSDDDRTSEIMPASETGISQTEFRSEEDEDELTDDTLVGSRVSDNADSETSESAESADVSQEDTTLVGSTSSADTDTDKKGVDRVKRGLDATDATDGRGQDDTEVAGDADRSESSSGDDSFETDNKTLSQTDNERENVPSYDSFESSSGSEPTVKGKARHRPTTHSDSIREHSTTSTEVPSSLSSHETDSEDQTSSIEESSSDHATSRSFNRLRPTHIARSSYSSESGIWKNSRPQHASSSLSPPTVSSFQEAPTTLTSSSSSSPRSVPRPIPRPTTSGYDEVAESSDTESPASKLQRVVMSGLESTSSSDENAIRPVPERETTSSSRYQDAAASLSLQRQTNPCWHVEASSGYDEVAESSGSESPVSKLQRVVMSGLESTSSSDENAIRPVPEREPSPESDSASSSSSGGVPKRIDFKSSLAERIAYLDSFYAKMPYPPCSNVYK